MHTRGYPRTLPRPSPRIAAIALGFVAVLMVTAIAGPIPDAGAARSARVKAKERVIRTCANRLRARHGLEALRYSPSLAKAARFQSRNMARKRFFDHTDPAGRRVGMRVARYTDFFGKRVGENIGAGYRTSRAACRAWFRSSGHRANILDPDYTSIGTGYAFGGRYGRYYTQVFGTDR